MQKQVISKDSAFCETTCPSRGTRPGNSPAMSPRSPSPRSPSRQPSAGVCPAARSPSRRPPSARSATPRATPAGRPAAFRTTPSPVPIFLRGQPTPGITMSGLVAGGPPPNKVGVCPAVVSGGSPGSPIASSTPTRALVLAETPAIQAREAPVKRFTCKREVNLSESYDLDGEGMPDIEDLPEGMSHIAEKLREILPPESYGSEKGEADEADHSGAQIASGPGPSHMYVPSWLMYAYEEAPDMFQWGMHYYFKKMQWPPNELLPQFFLDMLNEKSIALDSFQKTRGFAPVWMFILYRLVKSGRVEEEYLARCLEMFFEQDRLPALAVLPDHLQVACEQIGVGDFDYYYL